ncbi:MAG TPA: GDSL-type esterase/lipase family protein, partial [Mycobacteriales bacterium]|nr:GDSL-type esterase/lipase family protein [Mycobacteriales bacterium]
SLGGTRVRVHLSNAFSGAALYLERVTVGVPAGSGSPAIRRGTLRDVTFGGNRPVIIPAGGAVLSDPVDLAVSAGGALSVSTYTPFGSGPVTYHRRASRATFLAAGAAAADLTGRHYRRVTTSWYYLTGVDVFDQTPRQSVVALGDSLTDGPGSGRLVHGTWPDLLAARLGPRGLAVLGAGIAGNRLLTDAVGADAGPSALHRLDPDALDQAGVRTVVLVEGINDVQLAPARSAGAILAAVAAIVARAHARGVRVVCGTLPPYRGFPLWTPAGEAVRDAVNARLRTGGPCDSTVDVAAALADPASPRRLAPALDSGDHLHPNDAGLAAIAAAVYAAVR